MPDIGQLNLPAISPPANLPNAPENIPPPLTGLTQGIQSGATLGLAARQQAALEQERQTQMFQAQAAAQQAAIKNKVDLLSQFANMHEKYSDVRPFQKQIMMQGFIPTYNSLAQDMGQPPIQADQIDFEADKDALKDFGKLAVKTVGQNGVQGLPELFQGTTAIESHYGPNSAITKSAKGIYDGAIGVIKQTQAANEFKFNQQKQQQDLVTQGRSDFLKQSDEPIKAQNAAIEAKKLLANGNPIGDQVVSIIAPRAEGVSQRLNQTEIGKWGGSQAIDSRIQQAIQQASTGKFTANNRELFNRTLDILSKSTQDQIDNNIKQTATAYSQRTGMNPVELIPQIAGTYGTNYIQKHQKAIEWAKQHPKDPASIAILQKAKESLGQ